MCRTSGDEFVVFLYNVEEDELERMMNGFYVHLLANDRISACGYTHGVNVDPLNLLHDAQENMYKDKEDYYKDNEGKRRI